MDVEVSSGGSAINRINAINALGIPPLNLI